jgi:hypothetical protein
VAQSWTWTYAAKEAFPTPKGEAVAQAKLNHLLLAAISNPICEHFRGADFEGGNEPRSTGRDSDREELHQSLFQSFTEPTVSTIFRSSVELQPYA